MSSRGLEKHVTQNLKITLTSTIIGSNFKRLVHFVVIVLQFDL